jgi:hypothetical protein
MNCAAMGGYAARKCSDGLFAERGAIFWSEWSGTGAIVLSAVFACRRPSIRRC